MTARPVRQPPFRTARADGLKGSIPSGTGPKNGATASALPVGPRLPGKPRPETVAAQAGAAGDPSTGAIVPPIHLATTFVRDADNQYRRGYCYGRSDNATVRQVEHVLNELEHGAASLLFASGMAAATSAFLALERPAHVVAPTQMYWGLRQWLMQDAPSHGLGRDVHRRGQRGRPAHRHQTGPDQARLDRDPIEPDLGGDGYRGGGAVRPRGWCAAGRQLHGATRCSPVLCRLGPIWWCTRRPSTSTATPRSALVFARQDRAFARSTPARHAGGDHRALRGRAAAQGLAHAARARAPSVGLGHGHRPAFRRSPRRCGWGLPPIPATRLRHARCRAGSAACSRCA